MKDKGRLKHGCKGEKRRQGPSSYGMHDSELVFEELKLREGQIFVDLGCGAGDYAIEASRMVGRSGRVYALDIQDNFVHRLANEVIADDIHNVEPIIADITKALPFEDNSVDVCFIATVLHSMKMSEAEKPLFTEIHRVLKPNGQLAVIECKKERHHFGPPSHLRMSPKELELMAEPYGFSPLSVVDLGFNYMLLLSAKK